MTVESESSSSSGDQARDEGSDEADKMWMKALKALGKMWKSDKYREVERRRMQAESILSRANHDVFLQKTVPIIAAAVTGLHELNVELALKKQADVRKMKEEERAYADTIEERN